MIKVLIVTEYQMFGQGLALIIKKEKDMKIIGTTIDLEEILKKTSNSNPDVILIHTLITSVRTDEITSNLIKRFPKSKVVYVLPFVERNMIINGIEEGVDGFILDGFDPTRFINAIRDVYHNQYVLSGEIAKIMINEIKVRSRFEKEILQQKLEERNIIPTKRDLDVLYLILKRKSNKEIAKSLRLTEKTIRDYVSMAYKKIDIKNRKDVYQFLEAIMKD